MKVAPGYAGRISRLTAMYVHQRVEVYGPKGRTGPTGQSDLLQGLGCLRWEALVPWSRLVSM